MHRPIASRRRAPANARPPADPNKKWTTALKAKDEETLALTAKVTELTAKLKENDGYLAEVLATRLIQLARKGSLKALEMILERTEGRPTQTMNVNSNESPKVVDLDTRIKELLGRAAAREDDAGRKDATPGASGDSRNDPRVQ